MVEGRILLGLVLDAGFGAKWHPPEHFPHGVLKARDGWCHLYRAYLLQKESRLIGTRGLGILGSIPQFHRDATSTASVGAAIVLLLDHRCERLPIYVNRGPVACTCATMKGGLPLDPFFSSLLVTTLQRLAAREALAGSKWSWIGTSEQVHSETKHSPYYARVVESPLQNK